MENSDNEALIFPTDVDSKTKIDATKSRWRTLLTLCIILVVYKGGEEMAKTTFKQFVFSWSEHYIMEKDLNTEQRFLSNNSDTNSSDNTIICGKKEKTAAGKLASQWEIYFDLLNVVLLFFSVSSYGLLSDYLGRKLFFCLALVGWTLRCVIICVIIYFDLYIAWVLLAYGIDGMCGSHFVISMLSFASTADNTNEAHERVLGIAIMEAVLGLGKFTTQFGNGYFIKGYGYFYPMLTSTASSVLALLIAIAFLKDLSDTKTNLKQDSPGTSSSTWGINLSQVPSFKTFVNKLLGFYFNKDNKQDRAIFWVCLIAFLLTEFGQDAMSDPLTLYQLNSPFCWTSDIIGWYNTSVVLVTYIVGCVVLKVLQRCFLDSVICCVGTLSAVAYLVVTGFAQNTLWLFIGNSFLYTQVCPHQNSTLIVFDIERMFVVYVRRVHVYISNCMLQTEAI